MPVPIPLQPSSHRMSAERTIDVPGPAADRSSGRGLIEPILEVDVEIAGELAAVRIAGELDIGSEHLLTDAIGCVAARTTRPPGQVVLDLSGVTFCDVAGLRAIENSAAALSRAGSELVVRHPSRTVLRLLALRAETHPSIERSVAQPR